MLDRIFETAVRNRMLVLLALIALVGTAALPLQRLNLDAFPDVTNVQVTVNTEMENIFKHLSRGNGASGIALRIKEAAREVGRPMFFAVVVVVVVVVVAFGPLFTLEGVEGKLFQPMAIAIVLAMFASVLVALTVVPALASYIFRRPVRARTNPFLFPFERARLGVATVT